MESSECVNAIEMGMVGMMGIMAITTTRPSYEPYMFMG